MIKKTGTVVLTVLAFLVFATLASANVTTVKAGSSSVCLDASWIVYNLSETEEANIQFDIGPYSYAWKKVWNRTLPPGGVQTNAVAMKSTITNKGPGVIQLNCQRKLYDSHDWKVDAGSGKTYQPNYHMDHVRPGTYIEPGLGLPEGTERSLGGVTGHVSEAQR